MIRAIGIEAIDLMTSAAFISGTGQALWKRAKKIIAGGNMLLSKRPEMFLPEQWPAYFSHSRGCEVWDLDGRRYLDFSLMGVGTNILGYGNQKVDAAVRKVINSGNMSTLNAPEEVYLAERLLNINPWADQVRFARSGGEANAVAIRLARAASGRDGVAVCGYHGWHDWYLSANLASDSALDGHLLPGLDPAGVPRNLAGTVFPFEYNNFGQLLELVSSQEIGVIKMEVSRGISPEPGFLENVRKLASSRGIALIFDECTSGFRETFGGLSLKFGVQPDVAVFGKTLGNGYAVTAVVGKSSVMDTVQRSFISSTFWTERIGSAAGLATLEVMEQKKSWEIVSKIGSEVKKRWQSVSDSSGVGIEIGGLDALATFNFADEKHHQVVRTFLTQEMLKRGFLATNVFYASTAHTSNLIDQYEENLLAVFQQIAELGSEGVMERLEGPIAHSGFKRLN